MIEFSHNPGNVLATESGRTVGYAVYNSRAEIRDIFVNVEYRRQGVGRQLIQEVERRTGLVVKPMPPVTILGKYLFKNDV